jgi:TolA protein
MAMSEHDVLVRGGPNAGLVATIALSALLHAAAIAVLISLPGRFRNVPPPLTSYTVELVAPGSLARTNLRAGSGGAPKPSAPRLPPKAEPSEAAPRKAPVAVAEVKPPAARTKAADAETAKPPAPKAVAKPPEPAEKAPTRAEAPKAVAAKAPPPKPQAVEPAKKPVAAEAAPKPEPRKDVPEEKPAAPKAKPEPVKQAAKEKAPPEKPATQAGKPVPRDDADATIAKAVAARARQVEGTSSTPGAAGSDLDSRIAAAVRRRVAEQLGAGGATAEGTGDGGPVSSGPGVGPGGTPMDLEYIAYRSQMEARIKESWAWAGANRSLAAVVAFNITPSGEIANVRTVTPSGDPSYDASAERAVRKANPLAPPPEKYREEFWSVELEFRPEDARP